MSDKKNEIQITLDFNDLKIVCNGHIKSETKKGNIPRNLKGEQLNGEQYFQESIAMFQDPVFKEMVSKHIQKKS